MSRAPHRRALDRVLGAAIARRTLASIRWRSGLDAELARLGERVARLERMLAPGAGELSTGGSSKMWATPRDAAVLEHVLTRLAARAGGALSVLEWGSGMSTLHYPDWLARSGVRVSWLAVEHDRQFARTFLEEALRERGAQVVWAERLDDPREALRDRVGVTVVVFDKGTVDPIVGATPEAERAKDLDDYVALPAQLGCRFHAVLVDGRKRRRCLHEAATLLEEEGVALLHDAQRPYYHCAFPAFRAGRFVGDELWIGAQVETDFADLVPAEALGPRTGDQVKAKRVGASSSSSAPA